jgi:hypothetical protein
LARATVEEHGVAGATNPTLAVGAWRPFVALRAPKLYNLRTDPFERADITSNTFMAAAIGTVPTPNDWGSE